MAATTHIRTPVVEALFLAGRSEEAAELLDEAVDAARATRDAKRQDDAFADVAGALAREGHHDRTMILTRLITDPTRRAEALVSVAGALTDAGHDDHAVDLLDHATRLADVVEFADEADHILGQVVVALAALGRDHHARQTLDRLLSNSDGDQRDFASHRVAQVLAEAGYHDRAVAVANSIQDRDLRLQALASVAQVLGKAGQEHRAAELVDSVFRSVELIPESFPPVLHAASGLSRSLGRVMGPGADG